MENQIDLKEVAKLLGKRGGVQTLKNNGKDHFREMGRKSAEVRKALKEAQKEPLS